MRPRMRTPFALSLCIFFLITLVSGSVSPASAQPPQPTTTFLPQQPRGSDPFETSDSLLVSGLNQPVSSQPESPNGTGGPDQFGYTWDDTVPYSWVDATSGTDTGIGASVTSVGPITVPFSFKFYENTYDQIYISRNGVAGFTQIITASQSTFPDPALPNNIIAPYWSSLYVGSSGSPGKVYYSSGGTAPNRYFVVEWHAVTDNAYSGDIFTFEVLLYESGDIRFQYATMQGSSICVDPRAGIEDSAGQDGLAYERGCTLSLPGTAVVFSRPAAAARFWAVCADPGRFSTAGVPTDFEFEVRNLGDLGSDTFNLSAATSWPVTFHALDGTTPISSVGPLAQGSSAKFIARVQTPLSAVIGNSNTTTVTVTSTLNPTKTEAITLQVAVPAPFAQAYADVNDTELRLYLVRPEGQSAKPVSPYSESWSPLAVAEATGGNFLYAWTTLRQSSSGFFRDIKYALVDKLGNPKMAAAKLTDHTGATKGTADFGPAVAVLPNGRIGMLWYTEVQTGSGTNSNLYFAILDASGSVLHGPTNLTNNTAVYISGNYYVPLFGYPQIAATDDNRFVLAWRQDTWLPPQVVCYTDCHVTDIYYSVMDANGGLIKSATKLTNDTPGTDNAYSSVTLAQLSGSKVFLGISSGGRFSNLYFGVVDSSGTLLQNITLLLAGGGYTGWDTTPDAVRLPGGRILVAWMYGAAPNYQIRFALLDSTFQVVAGPTTLTSPPGFPSAGYPSVTTDSAGHGIITWMDYGPIPDDLYHLYYALVDSNGQVLTSPMIFRSGKGPSPRIWNGYLGYGSTTYNSTPPSGVDLWVQVPSLVGGGPAGQATMKATYGNNGATVASSTMLTATLAAGLSFVSANPSPASTVGNKIVWNLPSVPFLNGGEVSLTAGLPNMEYGTRYPVTWQLASAGPELNLSNNVAAGDVMIGRLLYLPLTLR